MTYNVFGGTLSLTQSINHYTDPGVWLVVRGRLEPVQKDGLHSVAQRIRVTVAATKHATTTQLLTR